MNVPPRGTKVEIIHQSSTQKYARRTVGVLLEGNERDIVFSLRPQFGTSSISREDILRLTEVPSTTPIVVNERAN